MKKFTSNSVNDTYRIAKEIAETLQGNETIFLQGGLGSGKTTFTKGLAQHFGIPEKSIKSPTYTILREYTVNTPHLKRLIHVDLYRLAELDQPTLETLNQHINQIQTLTIIEWPERLGDSTPSTHHLIEFNHQDPNSRQLTWIKND